MGNGRRLRNSRRSFVAERGQFKSTVSVRCRPVLATPSECIMEAPAPAPARAPQTAIDGGCLGTAVAVALSERTVALSTVGDQTSLESLEWRWRRRPPPAWHLQRLVVPRAVIDVLLVIIIVCTLVGLYLLRRYARAKLLYHRHAKAGAKRPALNLCLVINRPLQTGRWVRDRASARTRSRNRSWSRSRMRLRNVMTAEVITLLGDGSLPESDATAQPSEQRCPC